MRHEIRWISLRLGFESEPAAGILELSGGKRVGIASANGQKWPDPCRAERAARNDNRFGLGFAMIRAFSNQSFGWVFSDAHGQTGMRFSLLLGLVSGQPRSVDEAV